jgi:putative hydrolases of HD superfamily
MITERLEKQMNFILEIDKLKSIVRQNFLSDGMRRENDTEHSWHLAVMTILLAEYFPGIDILKTVTMVLIHDVVEIDAGDTFAYDSAAYQSKSERENEAAERLFTLLPEDQAAQYRDLWHEFEAMETPEAICGAILDRIQPLMMNYHSKGKMWKDKGVTEPKLRWRNTVVFEKGPQELQDYVEFMIFEAKRNGYLPTE